MANYESVVVSNTFRVRINSVDDVRQAISYFNESITNVNGETFIGGYDNCLDEIEVVIDKRTNRVIGSFNPDYTDITEVIEENGELIEELLALEGIKSEEEYHVEDFKRVPFFEFIQSVLIDNEHVLIKEVGHEKLRYAVGCGVLITQKQITWLDIDRQAQELLEKEDKHNES